MTDPHTKKAAEIFGIPEGEVTPDQRARAKRMNYHLMYGLDVLEETRDIELENIERRFNEDFTKTFGGTER